MSPISFVSSSLLIVNHLALIGPGLDHIFIRLGAAPPRPPSLHDLPHFPCPHLHGNSSALGTNVTIPGQKYKYSV